MNLHAAAAPGASSAARVPPAAELSVGGHVTVDGAPGLSGQTCFSGSTFVVAARSRSVLALPNRAGRAVGGNNAEAGLLGRRHYGRARRRAAARLRPRGRRGAFHSRGGRLPVGPQPAGPVQHSIRAARRAAGLRRIGPGGGERRRADRGGRRGPVSFGRRRRAAPAGPGTVLEQGEDNRAGDWSRPAGSDARPHFHRRSRFRSYPLWRRRCNIGTVVGGWTAGSLRRRISHSSLITRFSGGMMAGMPRCCQQRPVPRTRRWQGVPFCVRAPQSETTSSGSVGRSVAVPSGP